MRIINVIVIKDGAIESINPFVIFEEQSDDVVSQAEKLFTEKVLELTGMTEEDFNDTFDDIDTYIEDGIFMNGTNYSVCLTCRHF